MGLRGGTVVAVQSHTMKSGLSFLVAARQCEIGELEQLALTSELVSVIARLIHALQRERGLSNVYLASGGARLADARRPTAHVHVMPDGDVLFDCDLRSDRGAKAP